ncbi:MAG: aminotransferase class I/II-fold pyridoxal phosphate-dependent enzyme [Patescibacteria group bacterium]
MDKEQPQGASQPNNLRETLEGLLQSGNPADVRAVEALILATQGGSEVSPAALKENQVLQRTYPELLALLSYASRMTGFPATGIPAQAAENKKFAAARAGSDLGFVDAGIGQGANAEGNVLTNPEITKIFDLLKPDDISAEDWSKVRKIVFGYAGGVGMPWYRALARKRALHDCGGNLPTLAFDPVVAPGGTAVLDKATDLYLSPGEKMLVPDQRWKNVDLQVNKKGAILAEYDTQNPVASLRSALLKAKEDGERKVHIYLNYANNPSGKLPTEEEAREMNAIINEFGDQGLGIVVYVDIPYHPFNYNDEKIDKPLYYYLQPTSKNVVVNVSVDGTKRDGVYGWRVANWLTLLSKDAPAEAKKVLETGKIAAMMRADLSFSNCLAQYLITRAMTGDALAPLKNPDELEISEKYLAAEREMVEWAKECALKLIADLRSIPNITFEPGDGGFFLKFIPPKGKTPNEVAQALKKAGIGTIALADCVRITTTIPRDKYEFFVSTLKQVLGEM